MCRHWCWTAMVGHIWGSTGSRLVGSCWCCAGPIRAVFVVLSDAIARLRRRIRAADEWGGRRRILWGQEVGCADEVASFDRPTHSLSFIVTVDPNASHAISTSSSSHPSLSIELLSELLLPTCRHSLNRNRNIGQWASGRLSFSVLRRP